MQRTLVVFEAILTIFLVVNNASGEYYWKISDDGKVIEAVPESPYVLAYPGSLVDFLRQVESVKNCRRSTYFHYLGRIFLARDDPELEQRLRREREHCTMGGLVSLDRENFKTSYSAEICPDFHKHYEKYIDSIKEYVNKEPEDEKLLPHCRQWHQEGQLRGLSKVFRSLFFASLPLFVFRRLLKGPYSTVVRGELIKFELKMRIRHIGAHPYLHLAAAAYWRQIGDLGEALGCYKTAMFYVFKVIGKQNSLFLLLICYLLFAILLLRSTYYGSLDRICRTTNVKRFPRSNNPGSVILTYHCELTDPVAYEETMMPLRRATAKNRPLVGLLNLHLLTVYPPDGIRTVFCYFKNSQNMEPRPDRIVSSTVRDRFWRRTDWPSSVDCQTIISRTDIFKQRWFPQVFISPENKGFLITEYLTRGIGLESHEDHPLPWKEPYCKEVNVGVSFNAIENRFEYAESRLKSVLVRLAGRIMEDIEVAQRIRSMMDSNSGPRWLALNLAALYWRIFRNAAIYLAAVDPDEVTFSNLLWFRIFLKFFSPATYWLRARLALLSNDVDEALKYLKLSLDKDPFSDIVAEDLLKVACSGKSSKSTISSQFPTVCCSPVVQNAVCFKNRHVREERCYIVDSESGSGQLIYNRCNGQYTGRSYPTAPYVNIVSPFLPIFNTVSRRDNPPFIEDESSVQTVDTEELPLDYGGSAFFAPRPVEWWARAKNEMRYLLSSNEGDIDWWEEDGESELASVPQKPLSFLWIKDRREMLRFDAKLPELLPAPSMLQISKGLSRFLPPRQSQQMCSGVKKLSVLLENQVSTWVSVTAKGEDIAKYVDLREPVPGVGGLQPVCPLIDQQEVSPILGLDHLPVFALSDQFLFYKPEKALTDALKSLGNERDSIEHVAARLHTAMLGNDGQAGNWLLCVLSSLYWRVVGDAHRAVECLRCGLQTAPQHMRDVALVSLANICHQAGLLHSALIVAGTALSASPNLVAIHFTIANIYASMGDYQRALEFYYSTLSLQMNFEPAKDRIRAIYCHSGQTFDLGEV
ncbi:unnamed protein product [Angiostrongylus costaricensis]|uniref:TPR_REGION domain-containing protein n=1 Tax=Angiostrongylus costaricensis TaxID=334426 RepID=A0A158PJJ7_ANGCS|nr:unnamed protein product [Angiostrongylus costaricensis]